ncbi:MAG TPA: alkaline phosphatase family protein [Terracidiphilus sp.]
MATQPQPTPSPSVSSVSVTCDPPTIAGGGTSQCNSTVQGTGTFNSSVTWSASVGTISSTGLFIAPTSAATATITATSTQNPAVSGKSAIAVQAAPVSSITSVSVTCSPSTVTTGQTSQCSATLQGTGSFRPSVTWSASVGTISQAGLFTAPAAAGPVIVTATSVQNPAVSGEATITVQTTPGSSVTSVSVTCSPSMVATAQTSQCSATVQGTGSFNTAVTWSASVGTISPSGLFTAPASAGAAMVTATSVQNTSISGEVTITVQTQTTPPAIPASKHVVMVMEENQGYSTVVGNTSDWPHLNALIGLGALATHYYADTHPSIGNYFMLTTGQTLTNNDSSTTVWNVDNIARRMLAAKVPFKVYAEGITNGYLGGNTGLYVIRHNPFAMLSDVAGSQQAADAVLWPFTQFTADEASHTLPEFSFVVPDVNDDAHNGTPLQADDWLQANVIGPLSGDPAFQPGGDGILIVVFDEALDTDTTHGGGHVAVVFWGPNVKADFKQTSTTIFQHESMLRTVIEALGLSNPPGAAANAPTMAEFFVQK